VIKYSKKVKCNGMHELRKPFLRYIDYIIVLFSSLSCKSENIDEFLSIMDCESNTHHIIRIRKQFLEIFYI